MTLFLFLSLTIQTCLSNVGQSRPHWRGARPTSRSRNMERISLVNPQTAQGKAKELLDAVKAKLGIVPNMTRAMAVSPPVLDAYLGFSGALRAMAFCGHGCGSNWPWTWAKRITAITVCRRTRPLARPSG